MCEGEIEALYVAANYVIGGEIADWLSGLGYPTIFEGFGAGGEAKAEETELLARSSAVMRLRPGKRSIYTIFQIRKGEDGI